MNAIMCELCGSNDVMKQGDYFVCQHCGTKYSLEDAKKLIGTVKIDNSDEVQKYLMIARRAKEKEDWEDAEKYYTLVEQNDPDNIEAIFYSSYSKARASLTVNDIHRREAIFESLRLCISNMASHYNTDKETELRPIIEQISNDIQNLYSTNFVYTHTTHTRSDGVVYYTDDSDKTVNLFNIINFEFAVVFLPNIIGQLIASDAINDAYRAANVLPDAEKTNEKSKDRLDYLYERAIMHIQLIIIQRNDLSEVSFTCAGAYDALHEQWNQYNPAHIVPASMVSKKEAERAEQQRQRELEEEKKKADSNSGCFGGIIVWILLVVFIVIIGLATSK